MADPDRPNLLTIGAIAFVAYAGSDLVHEVLGHGTAVLLDPAVKAVSLSTVALSSAGSSRLIAAAGTFANLLAGLAALLFLRTRAGSTATRYFAWLFATVNLLNATSYPLYSGAFDFGDWAVVIAGLSPHAGWRAGLIAVGLAAYAGAVYVSALTLPQFARGGEARRSDLDRLAIAPYWIGGALMVAGAALNPISPWLILSSGASSGFGAMAGLLAIPSLVLKVTPQTAEAHGDILGLHRGWVAAGIVVALGFVLGVGPGIRF